MNGGAVWEDIQKETERGEEGGKQSELCHELSRGTRSGAAAKRDRHRRKKREGGEMWIRTAFKFVELEQAQQAREEENSDNAGREEWLHVV
jgi:hypothetical protein